MYSVLDKKGAIREVQRLLGYVGTKLGNKAMRDVRISGVYDKITADGVKEFQKNNSLHITGRVDQETFYLLYSAYVLAKRRNTENLSVELPVGFGAYNQEIRTINEMLAYLTEYYYGATDVKVNNFFSNYTANAVSVLKEVFGFERSEIIDEDFYSRLLLEYRSVKDSVNFN